MRLRLRLVLASAAATVPVVLALGWYDRAMQYRVAQGRLMEHAFASLSAQRQVCESAPEQWGGRMHGPPSRGAMQPPPEMGRPEKPPPERMPDDGRPDEMMHHDKPPHEGPPPPPDGGRPPRAEPAQLYAYAADGRALNPAAPSMPDELFSRLGKQESAATPLRLFSSPVRVEVLVRMPWNEGPCALVLARGTTDPAWGTILPESPIWLLPVFVMLAAMLIAVGPVVSRIQRLTDAVKRSASSAYRIDVAIEGRDEVADLAAAFDAAGHEIRAQLEEKDRRERALREFVANTTHDVMVPLSVLSDHLTTVREHARKDAPAPTQVVISAMTEAHYMASLMHNLGAAARLEAVEGALQRNSVDLGALVMRVLGRHRPIAKQLEISIDAAIPEHPVMVSADMTLLEQAVSNVTYNAVRYNRSGGHVAIILESSNALGPERRFCLRVIDDGPGMDAAMRERSRVRGARGAEARTRAPDGQGLGLHIASRSAALHGYAMTLNASEHGGLEVVFEGPCEAEDVTKEP